MKNMKIFSEKDIFGFMILCLSIWTLLIWSLFYKFLFKNQYILFYIVLNFGLIQMSLVGKMSPDMQTSPSPTSIQLRKPLSSPI
jgi:hypothetical protein